MRKVIASRIVWDKIAELRKYLLVELKMSEEAAMARSYRIEDFIRALGNPADYPLCRFKRWRALGYRCAVFEKDWILAYEVVPEGVIVRDMSHAKLLKE